MSSFSPGPWHLFPQHEAGDEPPHLFEDGHFHVVDDEGTFVAAISGPPDDLYPRLDPDASEDPELLANAQLMAKAPQMLALLARLEAAIQENRELDSEFEGRRADDEAMLAEIEGIADAATALLEKIQGGADA